MDSSEHNETDFLSSEIPHNDGQSLDCAESVPVAQDPPLVDELNKQLDILKKQLAETQKLTALGELVGTTTHEFNNILMTVLNYAKMGMRHKDDQTRDKAFDKILAASQRAAKITNAVLGMARNRSDIIEPTDLGKVIEDALVLVNSDTIPYDFGVYQLSLPTSNSYDLIITHNGNLIASGEGVKTPDAIPVISNPVSYTHLTLPTNREV